MGLGLELNIYSPHSARHCAEQMEGAAFLSISTQQNVPNCGAPIVHVVHLLHHWAAPHTFQSATPICARFHDWELRWLDLEAFDLVQCPIGLLWLDVNIERQLRLPTCSMPYLRKVLGQLEEYANVFAGAFIPHHTIKAPSIHTHSTYLLIWHSVGRIVPLRSHAQNESDFSYHVSCAYRLSPLSLCLAICPLPTFCLTSGLRSQPKKLRRTA